MKRLKKYWFEIAAVGIIFVSTAIMAAIIYIEMPPVKRKALFERQPTLSGFEKASGGWVQK